MLMQADYKTPGVYIEEIPHLPPSISSVETAITAFIGYTEKAQLNQADDLRNKPQRIVSLLEYEQYFGYPSPENGSISVAFTTSVSGTDVKGQVDETLRSKFLMHYSMQMFFANGGGPCWITSVGDYTSTGGVILVQDLKGGLGEVAKIDEVTLLLFPDAINLSSATDYYDVYAAAINQAVSLQDRFVVMDVYHDVANGDVWAFDVDSLRNIISGTTNELKYAAAYFPPIYTGVDYTYKMPGDQTTDNDASIIVTGLAASNLADLKNINSAQYLQAKNAISNISMLLPPSPAIAGIYAAVDQARGVWKAPANVNIQNAIAPQYLITNDEQQNLNVDAVAGKTINVIRKFEGRGPAIVWGARTLAGSDNEWRYISVKRFFNMVEESIKKGTGQFVFEPNEGSTWLRARAMIENYLTNLWRQGALAGSKPEHAFYVAVGLGQTMTVQDILEGRMIMEIGLAVVRPAEFIILRLMQNMLQAA